MKININNIELKKKVIEHLTEKIPFSITRIGDGEMVIIDPKIDKKLTHHMLNRHLGYIPESNQQTKIKDNLTYTILNSDCLSLRKKYPDELKLWENIPRFYEKLNLIDKIYFDHDFHFYLMQDGNIDDILNVVKNLTIISSRDVTEKIKIKYPNIETITYYKIPGEHMFEENKKVQPYFPEIYEKIYSEINQKDCSDNLLLLGGGYVGKRLGVLFKERGGVSLDIGSVFDFWVGKLTRGTGRGSHSYIKPLL